MRYIGFCQFVSVVNPTHMFTCDVCRLQIKYLSIKKHNKSQRHVLLAEAYKKKRLDEETLPNNTQVENDNNNLHDITPPLSTTTVTSTSSTSPQHIIDTADINLDGDTHNDIPSETYIESATEAAFTEEVCNVLFYLFCTSLYMIKVTSYTCNRGTTPYQH